MFAIVLFIVHGVEEYIAGFHKVNPSVTIPAHLFSTINEGIFVVFQLLLWLLLIIVFLITGKDRRWVLRVLTIIGIVLVTEIHHLIAAFARMDYYPGLVTALLFPVLAFAYWRELLREWRGTRGE
jgi:hypothetical protein